MKQLTGKHTKLSSFIPRKKFIAHPGEGATPKVGMCDAKGCGF